MVHNNLLFTNSEDSSILLDDMQQHINMHFTSPDPDDDEPEDESEGDNSGGSEDPAIDDDVVHSPVVTQPGGKPKAR